MFTVKVEFLPEFAFMVNCAAGQVYKPFEWGLLLMIVLAILIVTISSMYNRANSFGGFYIRISYPIIGATNLTLLVCFTLVYLQIPNFPLVLNVIASVLGAGGVYVVTSEILWVFNTRLNQQRYWKFRKLDIVSFVVAFVVLTTYWYTGYSWIVNDIMSFSLIAASIKLLRIDSLKMGCLFLFSVVILETLSGLVIHYFLRESYNNFVINNYANPFFLQLPSITP